MADTCEHWTSETGYAQASLYAACPWCELTRLKQELSLAEEGLANYAQENAELRRCLDGGVDCAKEKLELRADLHRIRNQSLEWAMTCHHDCPACDAMYNAIKGTDQPEG